MKRIRRALNRAAYQNMGGNIGSFAESLKPKESKRFSLMEFIKLLIKQIKTLLNVS